MPTLRIAQLCPYDIDRPGGVQRHIVDLSTALHRLGHELTILAPRTNATNSAAKRAGNEPEVVYVGNGVLFALNKTQFEITWATGSERRKLAELLKPGSFDVVHFHTPVAPFLPWQALRLSSAAHVATFHEVPPDTSTGKVQRRLLRFLGQRLQPRLDGAIFASDVQNEVHSDWVGPQKTTLPPSTDLQRFVLPMGPGPKASRLVTILFLGRLEPRKGAIVLLKAFLRLRQRGMPVRLVIAGEGPERAALEEFIGQHQLSEVELPGRVADADMPRLLADCDIFCAPSLYAEGFGIVLAEAMAAGKPVVAAANSGYRTVLTGDASRFLVEPGSVDALEAALETLVDDPVLCHSLGLWGQEEARRYDSAATAPSFVAVYEHAIEANRRAANARRMVASINPAAPAPSPEG